MVRKTHSRRTQAEPPGSAAASAPPDNPPLVNKATKDAQEVDEGDDQPQAEPKVVSILLPQGFHVTDLAPTNSQARRRNVAPLPPQRSPLPKRRGRNEDPVGKRAKATKAAAAKAAKEAKELSKKQREIDAEAAKEKLADMEMDESIALVQETEQRVRRRSDIKKKAAAGTANNSDDSHEFRHLDDMEFSSSDDFSETLSDDDEGPPPRKKPKNSKNGKRAQPKLRDQVAAKRKELKGKKGVGKTDSLPVASGLNATWASKKSKKGTSESEAAKAMDDRAALSTRPNFPPSPSVFNREAANVQLAKANRRNPLRINVLASPIQVPEGRNFINVDDSPPPRRSALPSTSQQTKKPVDQEGRKPHQHKKSKADAAAAETTDAVRNATMPKGTGNLNVLPSVIFSSRMEYFATLFHALFASEEPFDHFQKSSPMFLEVSRTAFETTWPILKIKVEMDDVLYNIGYQRVMEKRGKIHDTVKMTLMNHFSSRRYSLTEIAEWVKWFCGTHGSPVFYETPVPQDGEWDVGHANYKKPRGFLRNILFANVAAHFLPDAKRTSLDFGPPRGLFVLILTAYEKVVRSYKTGRYVSSGDFSAKTCNTWVKQYNKNFSKKSAEWWKEIQEYCDIVPDSETEGVGDHSILDEGRAALPMSSP